MNSAGLKLYVLAGQNAVNYIPDHKGTTPVVEVRDENDVPVEGASVDFQLPENGSGGEFEDGKHLKTVLTNTAGQAQASFTVSPKPGSFSILVAAKIDTRMGTVSISQANSMKFVENTAHGKKRGPWYKDWRVLALIGGAAAAGMVAAILLTHSSSTNVVLTAGSPTFGAPH